MQDTPRRLRLRAAAPKLLLDVVETRQPISTGDAFDIVRTKAPGLLLSEMQSALLQLRYDRRITVDKRLNLVTPD